MEKNRNSFFGSKTLGVNMLAMNCRKCGEISYYASFSFYKQDPYGQEGRCTCGDKLVYRRDGFRNPWLSKSSHAGSLPAKEYASPCIPFLSGLKIRSGCMSIVISIIVVLGWHWPPHTIVALISPLFLGGLAYCFSLEQVCGHVLAVYPASYRVVERALGLIRWMFNWCVKAVRSYQIRQRRRSARFHSLRSNRYERQVSRGGTACCPFCGCGTVRLVERGTSGIESLFILCVLGIFGLFVLPFTKTRHTKRVCVGCLNEW